MNREIWLGFSGNSIADLRASPRFYEGPDVADLIDAAEVPQNIGDGYAQRLRGLVVPARTGKHTFWISSDDHSELWLSSSSSKFGRQKIAYLSGSSGFRSWDEYPSQKSVEIDLVAGQAYFIEIIHVEGAIEDHVEVAWKEPGGARSIIPRTSLGSYDGDPNDADNDELPDDWEIANGFQVGGAPVAGQGPLSDPDFDGFNNLVEAKNAMNPLTHSRIPGMLSVDTWMNLPGDRIERLTWNPRFTGRPDHSFLVSSAAIPENQGERFGSRIRGTVTAPVTGDYVFYVAGDDDCELWLSGDESEFGKAKIASFHGATNVAEWTRFPDQQSVVISLEAGRSYHIEGILKENLGGDHLEIGWVVPGSSVIEVIPGSALASHAFDLDDPDGDGLPDAWETAHGLNPASAEGRDGAAGDPDGDGISNLLEYESGGDPQAKNSIAGGMLREKWNGISGNLLESFRTSGGFWKTSDELSIFHGATAPTNDGDNFVARARAWITAPASGNYTFWIASDDESELWLSPTASKFGRARIASIVHSGEQSWSANTSQQSATIYLEEGQQYFIEALHKEGSVDDHLAIAWQVEGGARELIPASSLASFTYDANDVDNDDLPDTWELAHGFSTSDNGTRYPDQHPLADPDLDGVTNLEEGINGTAPLDRIRTAGGLDLETWDNINGLTIAQLTASSRFTGACDRIEFLTSARSGTNRGDNYGSRMRGVVIAPETGNYTFYLAGDDHCELWLSPSESQFEKEKIAWFNGATGVEQWDLFPTQQSVTKYLVEGEKYYIEALLKEAVGDDHVAIGWKRPGSSSIEGIPGASLAGHTRDVSDPDGDELPTSWEVLYGFDPMNAGGIDGAGGDPDWDGIPNWMEHRDGTDPNSADIKPGGMLREVWNNLSGDLVSGLTSNPRFYQKPDFTGIVHGAEAPYTWGDSYAQRLRGIITAPATGDYTFWISSDDQGELWLSPTDSKFGRVKIASCDRVVNAQNWDIYPFQKSATIHLVEGQRYFIEALHKEGSGGDHFEIGWQAPGGSREIIPAAVLTTYIVDPNDLDRDELPDDWESLHGFNPAVAETGSHAPLADPDGDGVPTWAEAVAGSNPNSSAPVPGFLSLDRWNDMPFYSIQTAVASDRYYRNPASRGVIADGTTGEMGGDYFSSRARGYISVPQSGSYRFWLGANTSAELWLSTGGTKYAKRRIAQLAPEIGTGQGVVLTDAGAPWDLFASQMSEPVALQAGQNYFIEVVHQRGHGNKAHFSIAWSRNDGPRSLVPGSALSTYAQEAADGDDDYLPDAWETANGLSITDNGLYNVSRQGERGDFDGDGLSNRVEYLIGTHPANRDSDGDGYSDAEEFGRGSDPLSSAGAGEEVVQVIDIHQPAGGMNWSPFGNGIVGETFRGSIEFDLLVPEPGKQWVVAVEGALLGQISTSRDLSFGVAIDGASLGLKSVTFAKNERSTLRVLTPALAAGTHRLKLSIQNTIASESFQILGVELRRPTGPDLNLDGIIDWLAWFYQENSISTVSASSHISPVCLEGTHRYAGNLALTSAGAPVQVLPSSTPRRWYANAPLDAANPTTLTASFEDGLDSRNFTIEWTPLDLNGATEITLREGDSLRFHFPQAPGDSSQVSYQISGLGISTSAPASEGVVQEFVAAGSHTLTANHVNGPTASLIVNVRGADFGTSPLRLGVQVPANKVYTDVASDLTLEVVEPLRLLEQTEGAASGSVKTRLYSVEAGSYGILARLSPGGPILDRGAVEVMGFASALDGRYQMVVPIDDLPGYWLVRTPILVTDLPANYTVRVSIYRAGVMFSDGTTELILSPADFVDGVYMADFLLPESMAGGYCHYVEILDENGNVVARY